MTPHSLAPDRNTTSTPKMKQLNTFLVEDNAIILEGLISTLEELAPVVVAGTAEDESSAVAWLASADAQHQVDLVIIDIFLKSGSGLGVLRRVKALGLDCKLVVLTNYATDDMREKCLALGATHVFDKFNDIDALILYCNNMASGEADTTAASVLH